MKQDAYISNKIGNRGKRNSWLAIYYGHPEASASDLIDIAKLLGNLPQEILQYAAIVGSLEVINQLFVGLAADEVQKMIADDKYVAFRFAACSTVIEKLIELAPDRVQEMIAVFDYITFRVAADRGHLAVVEKLIELAPDKVQEMVEPENYEAFRLAAKNGHHAVTTKLLSFVSVFAYAERHEYEFGVKFVRPFLQAKITNLRAQRETLSGENPHAVFNLEKAEE